MTIWQEFVDKIDIIIPVYHALHKAERTIFSFGNDERFHFTLVADGDGEDYSPLLTRFNGIHDIRILTLKQNSGPGMARNTGLLYTNRPYIMFIDAGDTLIGEPQFLHYLRTIIENPDVVFASPPHLEEYDNAIEEVSNGNNRMHGKVYQRAFLMKYNIHFNIREGRNNEDIGFNMSCRMIASDRSVKENGLYLLDYDIPMVCWRNDMDSLTRVNNFAFFFQKNNIGLGKNALYAIKVAMKNNVEFHLIEELIYNLIAAMYGFYYATVNERPEFIQEQLSGAIYMMKYMFPILEEHGGFKKDMMLIAWRNEMRDRFTEGYSSFAVDAPDMSIFQWLDYVKKESLKSEYDNLLE